MPRAVPTARPDACLGTPDGQCRQHIPIPHALAATSDSDTIALLHHHHRIAVNHRRYLTHLSSMPWTAKPGAVLADCADACFATFLVFFSGLGRMSTTCPDTSLDQAVDSHASCSAAGATLRDSDTHERPRHSDTQTLRQRRDGGDGEASHVIAVCLLRTWPGTPRVGKEG